MVRALSPFSSGSRSAHQPVSKWNSGDSRIARGGFLKKEQLTEQVFNKIKALNEVAGSRGQTLAEMALAWVLKDDLVTSVIVGASSVKQLEDNLKVTENCKFSTDEIQRIGNILQ